MTRLITAAALGAAILGAPAVPALAQTQAQAADQGLTPGLWEYTYKWGFIPLHSEKKCLKAAEIDQFTDGLCTRHYRCDYPTKQIADGKIVLKGTWTDKKKNRVAPVSATGSYTPDTIKLNVRLRTVDGLPLSATATGKRVAATCP